MNSADDITSCFCKPCGVGGNALEI